MATVLFISVNLTIVDRFKKIFLYLPCVFVILLGLQLFCEFDTCDVVER